MSIGILGILLLFSSESIRAALHPDFGRPLFGSSRQTMKSTISQRHTPART